ncbi:hypothetical protein ES702_01432 [subsurface metagenome]
MVISFSLEKPLNHLLNEGFVYTFRIKKRKRVGRDWFNVGRLQKKKGDCNIYLIGEFNYYNNLAEFLYKYIKYSGFDSQIEWVKHIVKLNKYRPIINGYLYRVDLR